MGIVPLKNQVFRHLQIHFTSDSLSNPIFNLFQIFPADFYAALYHIFTYFRFKPDFRNILSKNIGYFFISFYNECSKISFSPMDKTIFPEIYLPVLPQIMLCDIPKKADISISNIPFQFIKPLFCMFPKRLWLFHLFITSFIWDNALKGNDKAWNIILDSIPDLIHINLSRTHESICPASSPYSTMEHQDVPFGYRQTIV